MQDKTKIIVRILAGILAFVLVGSLAAMAFAAEETELVITTPEQLTQLSTYDAAANVVLGANIDMEGVAFTPAGTSSAPFTGTFDGNGHMISNLDSAFGLFAYAKDATVQNLVLTDCEVSGDVAGGVIGTASGACTLTNITVDVTNTVSGTVAGGLVGKLTGTLALNNCHVGATMDVYADLCGNYHHYVYQGSGMLVGAVENWTVNEYGTAVIGDTGITATNCTVSYGDWNQYTYGEQAVNGNALYTPDYKFTRDGAADAGEKSVTLPFAQMVGSAHMGIAGVDIDGVTEGTTNTAVVKFQTGDISTNVQYGKTVTLGQLVTGSNVNTDTLQITVDGNVTYTENADWTQSTLEFTGVGTGAVTIMLQDYVYCLPTIITLDVAKADPVVPEVGTLTATYGQTLADVELPEGFTWVNGTASVGNAGTQTHTAIYNAGENYNTVEVTVTVEVAKANVEAPVVDTLTATYGDTLADVELPEGFTWVDGTASVGNAGTQTHAAIYNAGENYNTVEVTVTVEVAKANVEAPVFDTLTATYGDTLEDVKLPDGFTWVDSTASVGNAGTQTHTAIYNAGENYNTVEVTVTVEVAKANVEAPAVDVLTATYGDTLADVELPENFTWVDGTASVGNAGTQTHTAIYNAGENYNTVEVTVTIEVSKADPTYTVPTGLTATYGDTLADVTLPERFAWKDSSLSVGDVGTKSFTAMYTPADNVNYNTVEVQVDVQVTEPEPVDKFAVALNNGDIQFLYRVGNANTVAVGSLFKALDGAEIGTVTVTVTNKAGDAAGTYTANSTDWTAGTIQFTGTGVVAVAIDDNAYANELTLMLEVVNATNVTAYSGLGNRNSVLLNDITMSSDGSYYLSGATLYGNGFTFDVSAGAYSGTGSVTNNYVVSLTNASLDNVKITGAVYTSYGAKAADDYNRPTVLSVGNNTIANSYISNCAAPVRVRDGNLEIVNTTLKGGNFANLDIRNGHVILENVTTINQSADNDKAADGSSVVGLGIVFYYEQVLSTATVEVKGTLTQYNHISDNDSFSNTYAQKLVEAMLGSSYTAIQCEVDGVTWVNTGIVSMTETVGASNIIDSRSSTAGYSGMTATFNSVDGYVYTVVPTEASVTQNAPAYETVGQYAIAPSYSFDYTTKNYVAKTDGSNDYCYEDNGTVMVSMDEGDIFSWDTSILTVTKLGQSLNYTVSMNGADYTGKNISFDTAGEYSVVYTYTDDNNYTLDAAGNVTTYSKTYTQTVHISVAVVAPTAKNAEFAFGSSSTAGTTVTIGNNTYVMPNVSATSSTVGSITVSGTTVYYPIVDAYTSDGATAHSSLNSWYMCFPVFKNAVSITDYADGGTGDAVSYNSSTTSMPSNLSLTAYSGYLTSVPSGAVSFTSGGADAAFKYQASASASATPTTLSNVLIYASPTLSNNARNEMYLVVQYQYKDNVGTTFYYYVGYHMPQTTVKNVCVTGDTLVTLADGSQKRADQITYEDQLLVWDFFEGEYAAAPASIIFYHGDDLYEVLKLNFSDGTSVKVINNHGFFDVSENNFVFIEEFNVNDYIGHSFVQVDGDTYTTVELVSYEIVEEYTGSYSIQTAMHNNFVVEGMFSITMPEYEGWFDYFEIGENMKYDEAKMQADIEKYGLYTYEEFAEYVTYEQFIAFSGPYLKVLVGRGVVTYDQILALIEKYVP